MASLPRHTTGTNTYVEVVPLTLHIGAEIRGVDLSRPLPSEQLKEVRDAFLKWKVVFFRGQNRDHAQHVAMARQFGEPTIGHAVFDCLLRLRSRKLTKPVRGPIRAGSVAAPR